MKKIGVLLSLFLAIYVTAQNKIVSGTVVYASNGNPVIGATIHAKEANIGTITNTNGKFSFTVPQYVKKIEITYVGCISVEATAEQNIAATLIENKQKTTNPITTKRNL